MLMTQLCLENNMEKERNVKLLLYIYEQMSGLNINFEKSEVLLIGGDNNLALKNKCKQLVHQPPPPILCLPPALPCHRPVC
jgi:hypothetical protein